MFYLFIQCSIDIFPIGLQSYEVFFISQNFCPFFLLSSSSGCCLRGIRIGTYLHLVGIFCVAGVRYARYTEVRGKFTLDNNFLT